VHRRHDDVAGRLLGELDDPKRTGTKITFFPDVTIFTLTSRSPMGSPLRLPEVMIMGVVSKPHSNNR